MPDVGVSAYLSHVNSDAPFVPLFPAYPTTEIVEVTQLKAVVVEPEESTNDTFAAHKV